MDQSEPVAHPYRPALFAPRLFLLCTRRRRRRRRRRLAGILAGCITRGAAVDIRVGGGDGRRALRRRGGDTLYGGKGIVL